MAENQENGVTITSRTARVSPCIATGTPILQLDAVGCLRPSDGSLSDQLRVDVDLRDVVDDHSHLLDSLDQITKECGQAWTRRCVKAGVFSP